MLKEKLCQNEKLQHGSVAFDFVINRKEGKF